MRGLNRGAVGNRIGEGNAEFQGVSAAVNEAGDDLKGCVQVGVSQHDERHERAFVGLS